jgi:hypothetical protein
MKEIAENLVQGSKEVEAAEKVLQPIVIPPKCFNIPWVYGFYLKKKWYYSQKYSDYILSNVFLIDSMEQRQLCFQFNDQQLNSVTALLQQQIFFEIFYQILSSYHLNQPFAPSDRLRLLTMIDLLPGIAQIVDNEGNSLLSYVIMMDHYDYHLVMRLIALNPRSIGLVGVICGIQTTPFHTLLYKSNINYEIALEMVKLCPSVAR